MAAVAIGTLVVYAIFGVVAFMVAALIIRWVFAIGKIVDLLGVIAQELRAANAVNDVDKKLREKGISEQLAKFLNDLGLKQYKTPPAAQVQPPAAQ